MSAGLFRAACARLVPQANVAAHVASFESVAGASAPLASALADHAEALAGLREIHNLEGINRKVDQKEKLKRVAARVGLAMPEESDRTEHMGGAGKDGAPDLPLRYK